MRHMKMQCGGARETNDYFFLALYLFSPKLFLCNAMVPFH